jgi:hypothetical protein
MLPTLLLLAGAVALFLWVLSPLSGKPEPLLLPDARAEIADSVANSIQEFRADLELGKIGQEDLRAIEDHLRASSTDPRG